MEGVTTAIVLFIFVCVLFPRLIDNRPQYYAALACTLGIIVLSTLGLVFARSENILRFMMIGVGLLQVTAIVLLFLSAGGLTVRGLTRDMAGAFEVIRRGESEREVIIPVGDKQSRPEPRKRAIDTVGQPPERIDLDAEASSAPAYPARKPVAPPPAPRRKDEDDDGPIPME